jgi:hypothetical protein
MHTPKGKWVSGWPNERGTVKPKQEILLVPAVKMMTIKKARPDVTVVIKALR